MFHNDDLKYILDNLAESFHMERFFLSSLVPQITNENVKALLYYNYKKGDLQIISIWPWCLPHCPWDAWNNPWRFIPSFWIPSCLYLTDVNSWRMAQHAFKESGISLLSWSHCAWWYNQNPFRLRWLFNTLSKDSFLL